MTISGAINKIKRYAYGIIIQNRKIRDFRNTKGKRIFYFGVPMHPNLGDLAQYLCIRDFFSKYYPNCHVLEIDSIVYYPQWLPYRRKIKKLISKEDMIFMQSGYCTQDLGGIEDLMHQAVLQEYKDNVKVILPQTVFFQSEARRKLAEKNYSYAKNTLFLARDRVSFEYASSLFKGIMILKYPDIVTTWIGANIINEPPERHGIFLCIRNDIERYYSQEDIARLQDRLQELDTVSVGDTTISKRIDCCTPELREEIVEFIENLAKKRLIITDRYHGTIFSLVANTPVIVIQSNDHKVITGVEWFAGVYDQKSVAFAGSLEDAYEIAKSIYASRKEVYNKPFFEEEYYSKLPSIIEKVKEL